MSALRQTEFWKRAFDCDDLGTETLESDVGASACKVAEMGSSKV